MDDDLINEWLRRYKLAKNIRERSQIIKSAQNEMSLIEFGEFLEKCLEWFDEEFSK